MDKQQQKSTLPLLPVYAQSCPPTPLLQARLPEQQLSPILASGECHNLCGDSVPSKGIMELWNSLAWKGP